VNGRKGKVHDISYQKISLAFSRKGEVQVQESERERWMSVERMGRERGGEGDEARQWGRRSEGKREGEEVKGRERGKK
jgi:hypothetical protein